MTRWEERILILPVVVVIFHVLTLQPAQAASQVQVGMPCRATNRPSLSEVDHSNYDRLLAKYVDEAGLVNYQTWKGTTADARALDEYLTRAGCVDLRSPASREAQLAYWINVYNALTIQGILREYPTDSIRNHTARLFGYNIWRDLVIWIDGRWLSLEEIEHEIMRPMGDPRIHFAIVCASMGCPKLRNEAYTAERLEAQLEDNAADFFAQPGKFRADFRQGVLYLSPILSWFAEDFGSTQADRLRAIAPYLPNEAARQLARLGIARIQYLDYDWSLNDQKRRASFSSRAP